MILTKVLYPDFEKLSTMLCMQATEICTISLNKKASSMVKFGRIFYKSAPIPITGRELRTVGALIFLPL